MPFEYAVRPFESRDSTGRIIIPSTPGTTHERATLTWGAKVTVDATKTQTGPNVICCSDTKTQKGAEMGPVSIAVEGAAPSIRFDLKRTNVATFDRTQKDECAADWDQMSYVASAIDGAFATLEADIEAGGAGKTVDHCKAKTTYSYTPNEGAVNAV